MEAKLVVILVLVAVCETFGQSSVIPVVKVDTDYSSFAYDVADPNTGDYKSQSETRTGGVVKGQYSLQNSDGTRRVVEYAADDNGFNAVVRKCPAAWASLAAAPVAVPAVAPAVVAARVPAVYSRSWSPAVVSAPLPSTYPVLYKAGPSVLSSWPYGSLK